jgi:probable rRNA maturation factor
VEITVQNRQRAVVLRLPWLRRFAVLALPECLRAAGPGDAVLPGLSEVEVALVSNRTIARVHREFMNLPEPTDVITFAHGEIVASAETARDRAGEFGHGVNEELALYIVHGLLHLNGFDDATRRDASRMHLVQDRIWKACRANLPSPAS